MTTYCQQYTWHEDLRGNITVTLMVSDTYNGLFVSIAATPKVRIFLPDNIDKQLKVKTGGIAENEFDLEMDERAATSPEDIAAITMIKAARVDTNRVYCGVFIDVAGDIPVVAELDYYGILAPEFEADDLSWAGTRWNNSPSPVRRWRIRCRPLQNVFFGEIKFKDLIIENTDEPLVPFINNTWENAYVTNRQGYFRVVDTAERCVYYHSLVSLNQFIRKVADNYVAAIIAKFSVQINIAFEKSYLDGEYYPVRWAHITHSGRPRYIDENVVYPVYTDDKYSLSLDPDGSDSNESIFVDYKQFKALAGDFTESHEPNSDLANNWREKLYQDIETFEDFIYAIGRTFGLVPFFEWTAEDTLTIRFTRRQSFVQPVVEIIAPSKASYSTKMITEDKKDRKKFLGLTTYMSVERAFWNILRHPGSSKGLASLIAAPSPAGYYNGSVNEVLFNTETNKDYNRLLFTIGAVMVTAFGSSNDLTDAGYSSDHVSMPYNSSMFTNGTIDTYKYSFTNPGLHTGIYIQVPKYASHPDADNYEPASYFAPVYGMSVRVGAEDKQYYGFSDYLNGLDDFDYDYNIEYNIDVPFYYGFRNIADGIPSWKCLQIGSKIIIDSVEYVVEGIKRSLRSSNVSIKLQGFAKYNFNAGITGTIDGPPAAIMINKYEEAGAIAKKAFGSIGAYSYVSIRSDGDVELSVETADHYKRLFGLSLTSAADGEIIYIMTPGHNWVDNSFNYTAGDMFFLNSNAATSPNNFNTEPLLERSGANCLYALLGKAVSTKMIYLPEPEAYIL